MREGVKYVIADHTHTVQTQSLSSHENCKKETSAPPAVLTTHSLIQRVCCVNGLPGTSCHRHEPQRDRLTGNEGGDRWTWLADPLLN
jgi:hypothetical protein